MQTLQLTVHCKRRRPLWPNGDEIVRALAFEELFETDAQIDEDVTLFIQMKTRLATPEAAQRLTNLLTRRYDNIHSLQVFHDGRLIT